MEYMQEHTQCSFPFVHSIVYGLGRPLVEHGLLPDFLSRSTDHFRSEDKTQEARSIP